MSDKKFCVCTFFKSTQYLCYLSVVVIVKMDNSFVENDEVSVRVERLEDFDQVKEILLKAFPSKDESELVTQLRNESTLKLSLVATLNEIVVGHILFSKVTLRKEVGTVHEIEGQGLAPLAVHPDYQKKGIGSLLIKKGMEILKSQNIPYVVVLGPKLYSKVWNFQKASTFGIKNNYGADEAFVIWFNIDRPADFVGTIEYSSVFDSIGC